MFFVVVVENLGMVAFDFIGLFFSTFLNLEFSILESFSSPYGPTLLIGWTLRAAFGNNQSVQHRRVTRNAKNNLLRISHPKYIVYKQQTWSNDCGVLFSNVETHLWRIL